MRVGLLTKIDLLVISSRYVLLAEDLRLILMITQNSLTSVAHFFSMERNTWVNALTCSCAILPQVSFAIPDISFGKNSQAILAISSF